MVSYTRPKNLREWLVRAALPGPQRPRTLRPAATGFRPCRRANCTLCRRTDAPIKSYKCSVTGTQITVGNISCQDVGVYIIVCAKSSGQCRDLRPTYVGECGDGDNSSFTHRYAGHLGSATNRSQEHTTKPVGSHFRLPGHVPDRDMVMIPIERIAEAFTRKARESFYIQKLETLKRLPVTEIEHRLNLSRGQTL